MSGGKGSSQTTSVAVPEYIEAAAQRNLNKAEGISQLGYTPYYGPDVAAFSPAQQAAFQNTAGAAGAFGLASPTDPFGGMGAPTDFGGVQGYSSAPLYQQSVDALAANRPGQKQYIDSFFIDPMTGQAGAGVQPAIDYTAYNTAAENQRLAAEAQAREAQSQRDVDLAIAQAQAGAGPETVYYDYNNETYNTSSPANTYITNPSSGITDTSPASALDGMRSDLNEAIIGNTVGLFNPTYKAGAINNPIANPTVAEMVAAAPSGMDYSPETGSYIRDPSSGPLTSSIRPPTKGASPASVDLPGNAVSRALNIGAGKKDASTESGYSGESGDGCVVATHAVASGAFTASEKRQAVVWCMSALHGKWWGEAVRRGYRHLGNKKIQQGKAREHYAEFRRYIDFASGKKRTARGGITFALRTAQFFVVGLAKRGA